MLLTIKTGYYLDNKIFSVFLCFINDYITWKCVDKCTLSDKRFLEADDETVKNINHIVDYG